MVLRKDSYILLYSYVCISIIIFIGLIGDSDALSIWRKSEKLLELSCESNLQT